MLNLTIPVELFDDASTIAQRYCVFTGDDRLQVLMTLAAVHNHACRLDFARLAKADLADLCHDVGGMREHFNVDVGAMEQCFRPRYALRPETKE